MGETRLQRGVPRGVSTAVGVVIMIAIAALLAATVAAFAIGFGSELDERPVMGFEHDYSPSGADNGDRPYIAFTMRAERSTRAADLLITDGAGNRVTWGSVWSGGSEVSTSDTVRIDGRGTDSELKPICERGQIYRIIYRDGDESFIVHEYTVESRPEVQSGAPTDGDGDGLPDWC